MHPSFFFCCDGGGGNGGAIDNSSFISVVFGLIWGGGFGRGNQSHHLYLNSGEKGGGESGSWF